MIYSLKGFVSHIEPNVAIIECNNIGFRCNISDNTFVNLKMNQECFLFIHMNVKDDGVTLFGFSTTEELKCFKILINISGVGPKAAISILSKFTPQTLAGVVYNNDYQSMTQCQGIGEKTAKRVILELKDKLKMFNTISDDVNFNGDVCENGDCGDNKLVLQEATEALKSLGYLESDILKVIKKYDCCLTVEEVIKKALKEL